MEQTLNAYQASVYFDILENFTINTVEVKINVHEK